MTSGGNNFNYFRENGTSLMVHFLPYAKIFKSSKGGHGPSDRVVNTPLPVASGAERRRQPNTNLMHSKAVRKPLVAINHLYILKSMFYSRRIKI